MVYGVVVRWCGGEVVYGVVVYGEMVRWCGGVW